MLKRTPLYAAHAALGAKLVDFAGWEMPLHYGSQIEEHHQVRRDAGMFDVSHMRVIDLEGERSQAFLRYLLANNVDRLREPGKALYSCMLNDNGGVIDDLIVYLQEAPDRYRLVVNAGTADKDLAWITNHAAPFDVRVTPRTDLAIVAVQGPYARQKAWKALPAIEAASAALKPFTAVACDDLFVARTGYTGEDGFELVLPGGRAQSVWQALLDAGVRPAGLGARDTLRLEAGMNLYGQDMNEEVSPLEAGLAWTVDLVSERDFVGKAGLQANHVTRQFIGLVLTGKGGILRAHQPVFTPAGEGEITSGGFSPTLGESIALARVPVAATPLHTVEVGVRDKRLHARVVKPPFVRNGKILV